MYFTIFLLKGSVSCSRQDDSWENVLSETFWKKAKNWILKHYQCCWISFEFKTLLFPDRNLLNLEQWYKLQSNLSTIWEPSWENEISIFYLQLSVSTKAKMTIIFYFPFNCPKIEKKPPKFPFLKLNFKEHATDARLSHRKTYTLCLWWNNQPKQISARAKQL